MAYDIYFDNAATTRVRPEVLEEMLPFLQGSYGNPSGIYGAARANKKAVDLARERTAAAINAYPDEIFFTGGGTEADNWAIKNARRGHVVTSAIEHHAVLHSCEYLQNNGQCVTYLPADPFGLVYPEDVSDAIQPDATLVTLMFVNNEIGTILPVKAVGAAAREKGALFHTDAVAAAGHVRIDVDAMNIDMLSLSAHKFYGPKGVGALYVRRGVDLTPLLHGGAQEQNRRAGTENVAGIVGLGKAIELAVSELAEETKRITKIRDAIIDGVLKTIPGSRLNGPRHNRSPNNANFSFDLIEGEPLLQLLDFKGISVSSGSACTAGSDEPSHVLLGIGLPIETARGSLRVTIGRWNTMRDADILLKELPPIVEKLRAMSPL